MSGERDGIRRLVDRAMQGIGLEPTHEQIAINEAAAFILTNVDHAASEVAAHTAALLREAEAHQLKFRELLKS